MLKISVITMCIIINSGSQLNQQNVSFLRLTSSNYSSYNQWCKVPVEFYCTIINFSLNISFFAYIIRSTTIYYYLPCIRYCYQLGTVGDKSHPFIYSANVYKYLLYARFCCIQSGLW